MLYTVVFRHNVVVTVTDKLVCSVDSNFSVIMLSVILLFIVEEQILFMLKLNVIELLVSNISQL